MELQMREQLWIEVYMTIFTMTKEIDCIDNAANCADLAVKEYDKRFNETKIETETKNIKNNDIKAPKHPLGCTCGECRDYYLARKKSGQLHNFCGCAQCMHDRGIIIKYNLKPF